MDTNLKSPDETASIIALWWAVSHKFWSAPFEGSTVKAQGAPCTSQSTRVGEEDQSSGLRKVRLHIRQAELAQREAQGLVI